jgi:3-hydroxyacyl-[acyl-carrier-protein] dehydratase
MPPALIFDISGIDLNAVVADQEMIRSINPQRGDMEQLNGVTYWDESSGKVIGYKDVRDDEFWVSGHIPGRPLLPGVLMIEAAAQLASFYVKHVLKHAGFIGFGGVEDCKFRQQVAPGVRLYLIAIQEKTRHKRFRSQMQALVNGQIVFEATIIGAAM